MNVESKGVIETERFARELGAVLISGDVVTLTGPLGAGKTAFVSGLAVGLGVDARYRVTSPTFVYAHIYPGRVALHHLDLYRLESMHRLSETGIEELVGGNAVSAIEWFEQYPNLWPGDRIEVRISYMSAERQNERSISATGHGPRGRTIVADWMRRL